MARIIVTSPRARESENPMSTFTVEIEAANADRTIWQALAPAENAHVGPTVTAADVAQWTADVQNVAEGVGWRVRVWDGSDADTNAEPAAEFYPVEVTLAELTRMLGLPEHEQQAVFAWTGETDTDHTWSETEAAQVVSDWHNDAARLAGEAS